ncbi:rhodanese-like domain-containing protein [Pelagicoccus albus]|uniref:Rhodanese-like domain-containing protein n=1 Tax=Pelagicoccus albus TaxID=415222 RepID=A0A7X1B799_9BACT|nr:rhodanese-like domain-containing protein [Pelagicoccus albus]MBC2606970.1 rhodanese-like domain-containing protein [Pelagicoccus albus]
MKRALGQSFLLLLFAAVLSLACYVSFSDRLSFVDSNLELSLQDLDSLEDPVWVDARLQNDYDVSHLPGAVSVNEENWEDGFSRLLELWTPDRSIVVYCSSQSCLRSHSVAERLRVELGIEDAFALRGGWEALVEAGLTEEGGQL